MDLPELEAFLRGAGEDIEGEDGAWELTIDGVRLACITDERFDRMRLIAPIVGEEDLTDEHRKAVLEANFHTALDARYATSDGVLYAAFLHPLSSLATDELESGLGQVISLVETFGTTYSGGSVVFGLPNFGPERGDLN